MTAELPWLAPAWEQAARALASDRLPAGILVLGSAGLGRGRLADAIAQARLCPNRGPDGTACGTCSACRQVQAGTHPDLVHVSPEEPGQALKVDRVRELGRTLALTAGRQGARCAVLKPADELTTAAANALLKTLEEPPPGVSLILIARSAGKLPPTIVSRCLRLPVAAPPSAAALAWLRRRENREDWPLLLGLAGGAPLAAVGLAETNDDAAQAVAGLLEAAGGQKDPVAAAALCADWPLARTATAVGWIAHGILRAAVLDGRTADAPAQFARLAAAADPRRLGAAWREAARLSAGASALNAALARERLVLLLVSAFRR